MTRLAPARSLRALALPLALLALMAGCGGGGSSPSQFSFTAVGPAGGVVEAGPAKVTIPAGALSQPTSVALLPEPSQLPLQPLPNDPCTYTYVGPIYCCGPVGQGLLVNGVLRMAYDEALIPPGFTEDDLVLLEWDNVAGVMRPVPMPPATQDKVLNVFEDPAYDELGHIGIGLRDCTNAIGRLLVQNGGAQPTKPAGDASTAGTAGQVPELWLVDPANPAQPVLVPTSALDFDGFAVSPDGARVLLSASDPLSQSDTLFSLRVDGAAPPAPIASADPFNGVFLQTYGNFYGWLSDAQGAHCFYLLYVTPQEFLAAPRGQVAGGDPPQRYEVWRRAGDASAAATRLHVTDASFSFVDDIRQSSDASHLMVWSFAFDQSGNYVDVVTSPAGVLQQPGGVPPGGGDGTPRFLAKNDDLYVVDSVVTDVNRHAPTGPFVETLFSIAVPAESSALAVRDFALAPDDDAFAAVVDVDDGKSGVVSELWMGSLSGGVEATYWLGTQVFVNELVWHPQGIGVFLDASDVGVAFYELRDDDGTYIGSNPIPVGSLQNLDVDRVSGEIAILVQLFRVIDQGGVLMPGIYLGPPDASEFTLLTPAGVDEPRVVRWVRTWRDAAGDGTSRVR